MAPSTPSPIESAFPAVPRPVGAETSRVVALAALAALSVLLLPASPAAEKARQYRSVSWEALQNSGPSLKQIGLLAVRHSRDIESSPWSVGCETLDRDQAKFSVYKDLVGELGAKRGRLQSGWAKCEKEKGVYDFAWLDECVEGLDGQGVEPWMCLCYGNPLYGSDLHLGASVAGVTRNEEAFAAWLKYVAATVSRYRDTIDEWEIWNEPNLRDQGCEAYATLLVETSETIRRIQPDAVVMGFSLAGVNLKFAEGVLELLKERGKLDCVDRLTYHPYDRNPDASYPEIDKLRALVDSYNPVIELYQGENGCPSALEWTHALSHHPWTESSQAKWLLRRLAGDAARGIPSSVFTIIDLRYPDMLQSFGLIRSNLLHEFIYKRPSYYAVQHLMGFFDAAVEPAGLLPHKPESPRGLTVAGFEKEGAPVVLVWFGGEVPGDALEWVPVDLAVAGAAFRDPVYVEMISGKVFELDPSAWKVEGNSTAFSKLPIWDSPVMIAERTKVALRE